MNTRNYIILLFALLLCTPLMAQRDNRRMVRKGNALYLDSLFSDAETAYRKAVKRNPGDAVAHFNLGNALLRQRNPKDAASQYEAAIKLSRNPYYLAKAYHNLGVILQSQKQYGEAIANYENALRHNPKDNESRYNLALCKHLLKNNKQNKQQNNNDKNKQNKDQKKQDKQQNKQNKQQQQRDKKQSDNRMSKDNAQRLLDAARQEEQRTQDKIRRGQKYASPKSLEENW